MRIAVFDYKITRDNPIGGCHLRMLRALASEHDFTVFAVEFDNPHPERIRWVRLPLTIRPLALLFVNFHLLAPLLYLIERLRTGRRFDLIQMVESNLGFGSVSYSHFCHRGYLKNHWDEAQTGGGLRARLRWLDHTLHAWFEAGTYRRVKHILVPSQGLKRELAQEFPFAANKIEVLPNAIDVERLRQPQDFDRPSLRRSLGIGDEDTVFLFAALGHFERKGLPALLEAFRRLEAADAHLIVMGGERDLIEKYRTRIAGAACENRVHFVGMQADTARFFWAADAFAFPSHYETFSLVAYEAAAARLPLLVPPLNGIEEIVRDGETGFVIGQDVTGLEAALHRFLALPHAERERMGERAQRRVAAYNEERFVERWRTFYREQAAAGAGSAPANEPTAEEVTAGGEARRAR